jgi:single-strand DNA-binding protein
MASLNSVCLLGHLTRNPEVRYSSNGTPVAALGLAVNNRIKRSDDSWQDDPCFVDVVVFGNQAEACAKYLNKGDPVLLEGRLQYRTWQDQQGQKRSKHEVIAFRVQFLPKAGPRSEVDDSLSGAAIGAEGEDDVSFVRSDDVTDSLLVGNRMNFFQP